MTRDEAQVRLIALNQAIRTAVLLIGLHRDLLDRFFEEARHFDTLGPILDPTLWNNVERRKTEQILKPVYARAQDLLDAYEAAREDFESLGVDV